MTGEAWDFRSWIKTAVTLIVLGIIIAIAGTGLVARTTDRMLKSDARIEAENWSSYLTLNITDYQQILEGVAPSPASQTFFEQARQVGRVYRFKLYDLTGRLRLSSDDPGRTKQEQANLFVEIPAVRPMLDSKQPFVRVGEIGSGGQTSYFAESVVPVAANGKPIGFLQVLISQDKRRELFLSAATEGAVTMGILLAIGPAWGFWYRTRQKRSIERRLNYATTHDPLTGLMNRSAWLRSFSEALSRTAPERPVLTVLSVEISGVRFANETLGNSAGDHLLKVSAERLAEVAGSTSFIARIGASKFGLLAAPFSDAMDVAKLAQTIIHDLSKPINFHGTNFSTEVSVGVALSPTDGSEQVHLVKAAEIASAIAHEAGRNCYRFFDASVEKVAERQRQLERFAGEALDLNALDVHYQPIIGLKDGKLKGFEALLRVTHPELGPLSPAEFVAAAENSGNIERIGAWCIEQACRIARQWPDPLTLSVNISPIQFESGRLIANLRRILDKTRFPAYRLELEITEGIMLGDAEFIHTQLRTLQEMGLRVSLDDFGTGYSSLSYLWKYPFSRIKIDQSFVRQIEESPMAKGIVTTIVSLGRSIGVPLTAEGIETPGQLAFLRQVKCEYGQGYLFSRPVPSAELAAIIIKDFAGHLPQKKRRLEQRVATPEVTSGSS